MTVILQGNGRQEKTEEQVQVKETDEHQKLNATHFLDRILGHQRKGVFETVGELWMGL